MGLLKNIKIEEKWHVELTHEFSSPYFLQMVKYLEQSQAEGNIILPNENLIFNAFNLTPFDNVKVVIIGQDPYHNPGQAMGLSFSVPMEQKIPPSLRNIYKELENDLNINKPNHGDLTKWAEQGALLLNAMLTVEQNKPGAHKKIGWQTFTNAVIQLLSDKKEKLIFLLWGNFAQSKKQYIDEEKHHVLTAAHPSPLARNAFSGCRHFSKANKILISNQQKPINWDLA